MGVANGRMYDPGAGMFLSPDPYIQAPDNWLNYNRYSYCLNNPFLYTDPSGEFIFSALAAIFCPALIPVGFGLDQGWMSGGVRGISKGMSFWDGAWRGTVSATVGAGLSMIGGSSLGFTGNILLGAGEGAITGVIDAVLFGDDISQSALWGAGSGAVFAFITSEEVKNFSQGKEFKNNQGVYTDMRIDGQLNPNSNWQQGILDYFGFDAIYDANLIYGGGFNDKTNKITLGSAAFSFYFDKLKTIYMEEVFHRYDVPRFRSKYTGDNAYFNPLEEARAKEYLYHNQGLFKNFKHDWISQINSYKFQGGLPPESFKAKSWHFIYKIPRRW